MSQDKKNSQDLLGDISTLAPISVSVYTRFEHFKQCIESLQANLLAKDSILYIFSDAAKFGDEPSVQKVRNFAGTIAGFKEVVLRFRETNGYLENMREAREVPLNQFGCVIRLEDDNIVSPHFLEFMNESLDRYKSNASILGVTGYAPPIYPEKFTGEDVYLSCFWSSWTYATWRHKKFTEYLAQDKPYADMIESKLEDRVRQLHPRLSPALKKMDEGTHVAGDQKLTYYMIKHGMYQIKPVRSLVKNIGHDGSGVHCGTSARFDQEPYDGRLNVGIRQFKYLPELDRLQYRYFYGDEGKVKRVFKKILRVIDENLF